MEAKKQILVLQATMLIVIALGLTKLRAASLRPISVPTDNNAAAAEAGAKLVPLKLNLPMPTFISDCPPEALNEHIEPPAETNRPFVLMVPPGTVNVALYKKVTCSDRNPTVGAPELVTDGDKEATDKSILQMGRGLQWVQIDLEQPTAISYILLWHAHMVLHIYHSVVVQIADNAEFTQNVRTVFNNDYANKAGLGIGNDKEYFETFEGRLISVKGEKARFIRSYSKGSTYSPLNRITEIEVYGVPVRQPEPTRHEVLNPK